MSTASLLTSLVPGKTAYRTAFALRDAARGAAASLPAAAVVARRAENLAISVGLGLTSVAVGLTELAAPQQLGRLMGVEGKQTTGVLRALGVREVMHGLDLLAHPDPTAGVRARVAGDLLDGAALAAAARKTNRPAGLALVAAAVLPIVLIDLLIARRLGRRR